MSADFDKLREIFLAALEQAPEQRDAYLDQICAGDDELRRNVAAMVRAQAAGEGPLDRGALPNEHTGAHEHVAEGPGTIIGPYKLLEQIGEGGFGVVYMAEQTEPVRRSVALKILKPGMDTRQVVARFEAERQALAIMDHPNIAKVFDGGATASGRPYFVMELVKGIPITDYCDQNQLTPRERLELFVDICHAVQHAHQKGIIHRDLKPSNVLVTLHDARPVVKVIDFGVAKATGPQAVEQTLLTGVAQLIGTPLYMSPEQAALNGLDVDTRSDIYSLGVLLYELLTGTTPFARERFKQAGYDEIRRIIREEEPPKPSTRISTLDQERSVGTAHDAADGGQCPPYDAATIAAQRKSEPRKLRQLFCGELDWIVMKSLEKDRNRRYESASALARDIGLYLHDEPVQACPPSAWYRFRKFARRNKMVLTTAALVAAALVLGTIVSIWQGVRAIEAEHLAQTRLEVVQTNLYFYRIALADHELAANHGARAEELLDQCPPDQRGWEWYYLKRRLHEEPLTPEGNTRAVGGVAFSPTGQVLASAGFDGYVRLYDPRSGACMRTLPRDPQGFARVAFSPDGQSLAAARYHGAVTVWDLLASGDNGRRLEARVKGVSFSPDGRHLAGA